MHSSAQPATQPGNGLIPARPQPLIKGSCHYRMSNIILHKRNYSRKIIFSTKRVFFPYFLLLIEYWIFSSSNIPAESQRCSSSIQLTPLKFSLPVWREHNIPFSTSVRGPIFRASLTKTSFLISLDLRDEFLSTKRGTVTLMQCQTQQPRSEHPIFDFHPSPVRCTTSHAAAIRVQKWHKLSAPHFCRQTNLRCHIFANWRQRQLTSQWRQEAPNQPGLYLQTRVAAYMLAILSDCTIVVISASFRGKFMQLRMPQEIREEIFWSEERRSAEWLGLC